jgi:1-acyl-sn-glycerol-3-phosphate acyltransferase
MRALFSILKIAIMLIWSMFCIAFATVIYLLTFQKKIPLFLAKFMWARVFLIIIGARVKTVGKENIKKGQHYLVIANHSSYSDIATLFKALPFHLNFIGKSELKKVPFLGWYMKMSGMIFIDRKNARKSKVSLNEATDVLKKGKSVVIFPEGTTSITGDIAPFKKGGMVLAHDAESTILPIRIDGTANVWPSDNNLNMKSGKVLVTIGKPIPFAEYQNQNTSEFLKDLRQTIIDL